MVTVLVAGAVIFLLPPIAERVLERTGLAERIDRWLS